MKGLSVLLLSIISTLAIANTSLMRFDYKIEVESEDLLNDEISRVIPLIRKGEIRDFEQDRCWPDNHQTITIDHIVLGKTIKVNDQGEMVEYHTAQINYTHHSCKEEF